ncbi:MAG: TerB family tellurite resistance protein [Candidatus Aminicenantaceae bacterium]
MLNLKKILQKRGEPGVEFSEQDELERIQLATCVVLLEVAKSDDEFSSVEETTITSILKKEFQIPAEAIEELLEVSGKKREESVDIWEFTNLINKNYSKEERMRIIECAWKIIYADEKLNRYEDHFVHKLAKLLRLRHHELIDAKMKVLDKIRSG